MNKHEKRFAAVKKLVEARFSAMFLAEEQAKLDSVGFSHGHCYEDGCDGEIVNFAGPGRTRRFKGLDIPIPDDFVLPTCNKCGDLLLDRASAKALHAVLLKKYNSFIYDDVYFKFLNELDSEG